MMAAISFYRRPFTYQLTQTDLYISPTSLPLRRWVFTHKKSTLSYWEPKSCVLMGSCSYILHSNLEFYHCTMFLMVWHQVVPFFHLCNSAKWLVRDSVLQVVTSLPTGTNCLSNASEHPWYSRTCPHHCWFICYWMVDNLLLDVVSVCCQFTLYFSN